MIIFLSIYHNPVIQFSFSFLGSDEHNIGVLLLRGGKILPETF